jgi:hypothetical protein
MKQAHGNGLTDDSRRWNYTARPRLQALSVQSPDLINWQILPYILSLSGSEGNIFVPTRNISDAHRQRDK